MDYELARGGTAPLQQQSGGKADIGGGGGSGGSGKFRPALAPTPGAATVSVPSPIRATKGGSSSSGGGGGGGGGALGASAVRPKTSSTADISDLNFSFRVNRAVNAHQQQQQQQQYTGGGAVGGGDGVSTSAFRRFQQQQQQQQQQQHGDDDDDQQQQLLQSPQISGLGGGGDVQNPAARNAWGSSAGARLGRGASEKDLSNRQPKPAVQQQPQRSALSVYLQAQPSTGVPLSSQRSSGRLATTSAATSAAPARLNTPNSTAAGRPRNAASGSPVAGSTSSSTYPYDSAAAGSPPSSRPKQKTSLYGSGNLSVSLKKPVPTAPLMPRQPQQAQQSGMVALDQSAAMAYLGGAPPVLRSSSTRSRVRLHVNMTGRGGGSLQSPPPSQDEGLGQPLRPQTHQHDSHARPSTQMLRPRSAAAFAAAADDDDVVEEILEYYEEDEVDDVSALLAAKAAAAAAGAVRQQRGPSPSAAAAAAAATASSRPTTSAGGSSARTKSPSSFTGAAAPQVQMLPSTQPQQPQHTAEGDVIYIGHHHSEIEANRKLERPTSRKPYLGAAAKSGEDGASASASASASVSASNSSGLLLVHPRSAGARPQASAGDGPGLLRRASSFGGGSTPPRDGVASTKNERPPSRQRSAFPIHLAEPLSAEAGIIEDWDLLRGGTGVRKDTKTAPRQSGQPVDLDDLDSDDEIFQQRATKQRFAATGSGSADAVGLSGSGGASSSSSGGGGMAPPSSSSGVTVQPLQFGGAAGFASISNSSVSSGGGASAATTSTSARRADPGSARRGSQSARRGSDPVADGFAALGGHDESWPFRIQVNYEKVEGGGGVRKQHTPRHISEMEAKLQALSVGGGAVDDEDDELSEFDLDNDGIAGLTAQTPRSVSSTGTGKAGRKGASPTARSSGWGTGAAAVAVSGSTHSIGSAKSRAGDSWSKLVRKCCLLLSSFFCFLLLPLLIRSSASLTRPLSSSFHTTQPQAAGASGDFEKANYIVAASPTFSNTGIYDDDGDGDSNGDDGSDDHSIIVSLAPCCLSTL